MSLIFFTLFHRSSTHTLLQELFQSMQVPVQRGDVQLGALAAPPVAAMREVSRGLIVPFKRLKGIPKMDGLKWENPIYKRMMIGGTPILRNLHLYSSSSMFIYVHQKTILEIWGHTLRFGFLGLLRVVFFGGFGLVENPMKMDDMDDEGSPRKLHPEEPVKDPIPWSPMAMSHSGGNHGVPHWLWPRFQLPHLPSRTCFGGVGPTVQPSSMTSCL